MSRQEPRQIKSIFGSNVRAARAAANLTQHELGRLLGVDPTYVSRWERGAVLPSATNVVRLAEALGCEVGWLYIDHEPAEAAS